MMRKITTIQELRVKVYSPSWYYSEMGGGFQIPERLYFDEPYENKEQAEKLLNLANQQYNQENLGMKYIKEPQTKTYWKDIEKTID